MLLAQEILPEQVSVESFADNLTGLVLIYGLDMLIGIRVSDEEEVEGLDEAYWDVPPVGADLPLARGR